MATTPPGRAARRARRRPARPRWRRQPQARPEQIVDAARRAFAAKGYLGATLDDVAREAGITKGTIYLYFPSKQALFGEVVRAYADEILAPLRAEAAAARPPQVRDLLRVLVAQLLRVFRRPDYQAMVRLIIGEAGRFPADVEAFYRDILLERIQGLAAVLEGAMDRGEMRRADPLLAARGVLGMVWHFALLQETLRAERVTPYPDAVVVETFGTILWEGLRP
jgi:AcrR family transcriptional regulator